MEKKKKAWAEEIADHILSSRFLVSADGERRLDDKQLVWTESLAREALPDVQVEVSGKIVEGTVRGRKNAYATVFWEGGRAEYSWWAVAHSLNSGSPLLFS